MRSRGAVRGKGSRGDMRGREGEGRQLRDADKGTELCPPTSNLYIMIINDDSLA